MRRPEPGERATARLPRFTLLLIGYLGLGGCFLPPPRGDDDPPDPRCGIFYGCGSHGDSNGGPPERDPNEYPGPT
jgi:hypothetical protein